MGKTQMVELAFGGLGLNTVRGTPRNPWDPDRHRVPGGSSSGAGVTLCEGSAWVALGTDTAGSVRIPASMTGNVGLKTSAGRWSCDGIVPLSPTLDSVGILTRSVADAAFAFACLDPDTAGPVALAQRIAGMSVTDLRIGIGEPALWDHCDPAIVAAVESALEDLEARGARLLRQPLPEVADAIALLQVGSVVSAECDEFLDAQLGGWHERISPHLRMRIEDGAAISAREYLSRKRRLRELARQAVGRFAEVDVIVSPTVPISPPTIEEIAELDAYRRANMAVLSNTCVANYLHLCALTMPVGLDFQGLPVGVQLLAPHGADLRLLAIASAIEKAIGKPGDRIGTAPMCSASG
jgi:aspartyl-tRNA(Asn)/glutamyl-tRNA(Gln) amidotransferase subunit A